MQQLHSHFSCAATLRISQKEKKADKGNAAENRKGRCKSSIVGFHIRQAYSHNMEQLPYEEGGTAIELIVHYPETPEKQALFDARVAKFHAEYVAQYIEKLNCPMAQKLKLIDAIAETILDGCEENKRNSHL